MKMQKYIDMAYGNPRGIEWLNLIHTPRLWHKWCKKVLEHTTPRWIPDKDRPEKILTAAIWHFGYAHDSACSGALRRTARRLRRGEAPPEGGLGCSKGGLAPTCPEMILYQSPLEFYLLDNFLEHEVRPMMDSSTKTSS